MRSSASRDGGGRSRPDERAMDGACSTLPAACENASNTAEERVCKMAAISGPEPDQLALMRRVVELAEEQTRQSAERTEQSAKRSYMNAERTLSVWTRTALSLMVFGIAVDRFGLLLRHEPWPHAGSRLLPNPLSTIGGVVLVALGVFMVATCAIRYLAYARLYRKSHAWPAKHPPYLAFAFGLLVALFGIALLIVLLLFAGK